MKRKLGLFLVCILFVTIVSGCSAGNDSSDKQGEEQTYNWMFAHEEVTGSIQDHYAMKFKELIEKRSEGRITVEVYPVGQLGDSTNQVELLQNGGIQFAINCPGATAPIVPESNIFNVHFLLPSDMEKTKKLLNSSQTIKEYINSAYYEQNMQVLDWFPEGYMMWTGDRPIKTPEDMKGFKIRTMASPMISAMYEAYGANPTPIPYTEVYSSLQLNMIDGQVNPLFAIEEMKFYEVQEYLMLSKQDIFVGTFCANRQYWESLPEDIQQMVTEVVGEVNEYIYDVQNELNQERLEKIKEASDIKIIDLTDEERDAFRKASIPAREVFYEMGGPNAKAIMEGLVKEIESL